MMSLEFLTDDLLIKNNNFDGPVIVTGAGGCIGAWILTILHRSNIPCIAIDLTDQKGRLQLLLGKEASKIQWEVCDITDIVLLKKIIMNHNPQAIIHLAGLQVPFCMADPALGARVNVEGTINILEILHSIQLT